MNKPTFCSAGIIIASLGKITTRNNAYNSLLVLVQLEPIIALTSLNITM